MIKKKIIVPMDRLGVVNVQDKPMDAIKFINCILSDSRVNWLTNPTNIKTERFPEGHLYSQGGFVIDYSPEVLERAKESNIVYDIAEEDIISSPIKKTEIALYNGKGAADFCTVPLSEVMNLSGFNFEVLSDEDIRNGLLDDFDILIVPGGPDAGESYYWGLGNKGYDNLKHYVWNRGQYFGICAGAYLPLTSLSKDNKHWLGIINATDEQDLDYWRTGTGFTKMEIINNNHPVFSSVVAGGVNTTDMVYWEGPAIKPLDESIKTLAVFKDFIASGHINDRPQWELFDNTPAIDSIKNWYNVLTKERFDKHLKDRAAIVETTLGKNKMVLYSPHFEFGNIGISERINSQTFHLITNCLFYLSI